MKKADVLAIVYGVVIVDGGLFIGRIMPGFFLAVVFHLFLYGFSGWYVIRKAHNKAWYVAAIPALLSFPLVSAMNTFSSFWYAIFILFALLGGLLAKKQRKHQHHRVSVIHHG